MSDELKKLKCPFCGKVYDDENRVAESVCPECGKTFEREKAEKHYSAFTERNDIGYKTAHGEDYLSAENLIDIGKDYVKNGDFKAAELTFFKALELTENDYRVYMGLVSAYTANYTDLTDEKHKRYLDKAVATADEEGKKAIAQEYGDYYNKLHLSSEELAEEEKIELKQKKDNAQAVLNKMVDGFAVDLKRQKLFIILFPLLLALGISSAILLLVFKVDGKFLLIPLAAIIIGYLLFRRWYIMRNTSEEIYELTELLNVAESFEISRAEQVKLYDLIAEAVGKIINKDSFVEVLYAFAKISDLLTRSCCPKAVAFVKSKKFLEENISENND